jgi:hypothetical protein
VLLPLGDHLFQLGPRLLQRLPVFNALL